MATNYHAVDEPKEPSSPMPSQLSIVAPPQNIVPRRKRRFASAVSAASSLSGHFRRGTASMKRLSCMQIFAIILCVTVNITAGAGQLLALNKLIVAYKKGPKNINAIFSVLTLVGSVDAVLSGIAFAIYCIIKQSKVSFLKSKKSNFLSFLMGFSISLNGILVVAGTPHVPEIIQAFLLSTVIIWTFLFVKMLFAEKRSYCSPFVLFSFFLSLGGILVGSASKFAGTGAMTLDTGLWCLIFAVGFIPGALNGVVAAKFMRTFTIHKDEEKKVISKRLLDENDQLLRYGTDADPVAAAKKEAQEEEEKKKEEEKPRIGTDPSTAKFAAFALGNIWQCILMYALVPMSVIPWFGTTKNMADLGSGLEAGYRCTFNLLPDYPDCSEAMLFFFLFNLAFVLNAISSIFLNYYSPALTSMINQLMAPFAALMLIIFPVLNVSKKTVNVGESIGAVVLISLGAVTYTIWEESTRNEQKNKEEEEAASQDDLDSPAGSPVSDPGAAAFA